MSREVDLLDTAGALMLDVSMQRWRGAAGADSSLLEKKTPTEEGLPQIILPLARLSASLDWVRSRAAICLEAKPQGFGALRRRP